VKHELPAPNYDEALTPSYRLEDPLQLVSGERVGGAADFMARRRPEVLELFRQHVYGRIEHALQVELSEAGAPRALPAGLGQARELDVKLVGSAGRSLTIRLLLHVPAHVERAPVLLGLNLFGNQSVHPDPSIRLAQGWLPDNPALGLVGGVATEASRGMHAGRWPVELALSRGYALATAYAGDIDPDFDDGFRNGLHALLPDAGSPRPSDAPGTLAAWAFGLSRMLDALTSVPEVDSERVVVIGHSRLGKAALWAAAQDERFALAVSNQSGCGGATLSKRRFGERLLHINRRFPHWFCPGFQLFNEREHELPLDQHLLLTLLAPRPVYVASAAADLWADPLGELLASEAASPVYELFGKRGISANGQLPAPSGSQGEYIGYHLRPGTHDITPRDFWHYLDFADRHLAR
jgi:hypothetical protein